MARSTQLVILRIYMILQNIYTLWGRKRFLLPVTYFPTNLVYQFSLRVTGIKIESLVNMERPINDKSFSPVVIVFIGLY